jgi:hypothetical protein
MGQWPSKTRSIDLGFGSGIVLNVPTNIRAQLKNPFLPWDKSLKDRWGHIIMLSELECGAPWELYVETAAPALLQLIKTVIEPGKIDLLKARLNHSYNCGFKQLFKDAEKYLPSEGKVATKFLFRIAGPVFTALWWYFLADAFTEFVYNWETAVIQQQQCGVQPLGGPCQLSNASNALFIPNAFVPMNWRTKDNDPSNWAPGPSPWNPVAPGRIGIYKAYGSASFRNQSGHDQVATIKITDGFGNAIATASSGTIPNGGTGSATTYGTQSCASAGQASFQMTWAISQSTGTGVAVTGGSFTVAGN